MKVFFFCFFVKTKRVECLAMEASKSFIKWISFLRYLEDIEVKYENLKKLKMILESLKNSLEKLWSLFWRKLSFIIDNNLEDSWRKNHGIMQNKTEKKPWEFSKVIQHWLQIFRKDLKSSQADKFLSKFHQNSREKKIKFIQR